MTEYARHRLPVVYRDESMAESHFRTRRNATLFDVSHMVQHCIEGPEATSFLERVTPTSWRTAPAMQWKLTTLLWPTGGIVDDAVVTKLADNEYHVVSNGACLDKVMKYMYKELAAFPRGSVRWEILPNRALIAVQGPDSRQLIRDVLSPDSSVLDLDKFYFGSAAWVKLKRSGGRPTPYDILLSRGGYTGEDGFELSFAYGRDQKFGVGYGVAAGVVDAMFESDPLALFKPAGLAARDSLRLEAGMCLYGQDINDETTPVEASLSWVISPERRVTGGFNGAEIIIPQLTPQSKGGKGVERRRVGLLVPSRAGCRARRCSGILPWAMSNTGCTRLAPSCRLM
ncbi:hypothetical protein XA68_18158 [Ophiocordyceps unilateralis]|uniref:GCVT N-terminal domain-containing protein n=1 Tax=Ophiocordyceps unilateralis TaxID=268505 RepID=A0A2A9P2D7_OPHUN|nr:hypothetical protein XA68_18158 [Ophiocordyceps unilateralis]